MFGIVAPFSTPKVKSFVLWSRRRMNLFVLAQTDIHSSKGRCEKRVNFIISAATDVGLVRPSNQDSFGARAYTTKLGKVVLAVLCDGMGGLAKGEVASWTVVNAFFKWADRKLPFLCETEITDSAIRSDWTGIAAECNEKIKAYAASNRIRMGTTLTAILLTEDRYFLINVGDTRAYEITNAARLLTKDQTLVAREVELGHLTAEQARRDSRQNVLLQCIGASESVYPDMFFGDTRPHAVYMLCSDGFRHEITAEEIWQCLNPDVMRTADEMKRNMNILIELNKERKERDNITVVTVRTF